eukprot:g11309.t1
MDGISEYEMERRRKMERNHRRLQELGLVGRGEPWKDPRPRKAAKPQRKASKPTVSESASTEGVAVRKSVRARRKPAPVYVPPAPPATALRGFVARDYLSAGIAVRKSSRTTSKASPSYREHDTDSGGDESDDFAFSRDSGVGYGDEKAGFGSKRSRGSAVKREERPPSTVVPPAADTLRRAPTPSAPNSSRERRRTTAENRAVSAEAEAAAAASAALEAIAAAIAEGIDNDGVAAVAQRAAVRAAAEAATAAAAASDSFENDGDNSESSNASSDVPVDFTYQSATELPTSLLWLYSGIKYEAETKEDLTVEQALYTMRNLYINRKEESGTSRAANGRTIGTAAAAPEVASSTDATNVNAAKETANFLDSELLPDLEQRMIECTKIDPPIRITVAGQGQLPGTAKGVLKVIVTDQHGNSHPVRLPFICVPNLGRHLFSGGTARKQGVSTFIGPASFLDVGVFKIPLRPDEACDTMFHFDLAIAPDSVATQHAFPTISGADLPPENANTVSATASSTSAPTTTSGLAAGATAEPSSATALVTSSSATASANTWHQRLGHPNVQVLEQVARTDGSGVVLRDSFSACGTCRINKSTQQNHPKTVNTDNISRRLQVVSTDLLGPVSTTAIGGFNYMAKFTDHASRLKAVYFIAKKSDALSSLVNFVLQDIAIPLGLRVEYLHSDNGGEFVNSKFRHYYKTTGIIQHFSSPHTPQQNGISERDGRTITNMTRCLLNEANLPKHLWGEIAATSVFLVNRLPHKALKGNTPYWRMFGKQANLSFLRIIGSRAFVHVEGHNTKRQPRAWEGVLVGYENDSPTFRIYNRTTGHITSSRNVTFIESSPAVLPPADSSGDLETENESDSPDVDNINDGITLLEQDDNSDSNKPEPAATISSRLRSSGHVPLPQPGSSNARQARELRQLNLTSQDHPQQMLDSYTEYISTVGLDSVLPPAAVEVPNTFKQAMSSPQSAQWDKAMRKEFSSLQDHDVADLIPISSVPASCSIIGTRWVYRVKTDGRFKARVVVQGWAQRHGIDCFTTFAPVCRIGSQRLLLAIAAAHGWLVLAMDVQTAFLNGILSEDVYTDKAPGFEQLDGNGQPLVWKLRKAYTDCMDSCNPSHTPGTGVDDKTSTATLLSDADKKEYQSLVGSLIFLINCTRYDIAFATMMAARSMSSPTQRDLANAKRILRYLKKQPDLDITYRRDAKFELTLYSDASYAQAPGYKSTTGSMAFLSGALVHFNSQTQRILAQSSSEAEVIAVNTTAKQGVYLTNIMGELGWRRQRTFSLLTDNRSALSLVANGAFSSRSKHIAVRYNALREWAKENRFRLHFVSSASMLADICTKNLECDIPMLMEQYLGRQFPSFGKAPVMELSTKSCPPKFSRMSGVTEWKNAVFLWVNVDGGNGYENLFERDPSAPKGVSADATKAPGEDPTAAAVTRQTYQFPTGTNESESVDSDWRIKRNPRRGTAASSAPPAPADRPPLAYNNDNSNSNSHDNGDAQRGARARESTKETTTTTGAAAGGGGAAATAGVSWLTGLRMTWFASGRVTAESALIQRLLLSETPPKPKTEAFNEGAFPSKQRTRDNDDDGGGGGDDDGGGGGGGGGGSGDEDVDAVLLFCRLPNEPYVFCGRLGYSKHWADERPIRFVWRLLDAERLAGSSDFEAVVEVAGVEGA